MSAATGKSTAIIVLGMHRSGTSALSGVISMLGANPGPTLLPALQEVNPKGFWEHEEIVAIHERLLSALGSSWDDERKLPDHWWQQSEIAAFRSELLAVLRRDFAASPLWLLKDPRLCRLLPLWTEILREFGTNPHFIICLRHPTEVARSLQRRDNLNEFRGNLLWLRHLLESEQGSRGQPRVVVSYAQLLHDWRKVIWQINDSLGPLITIDETIAGQVDDFLEPSLRHHHAEAGSANLRHRVCELALQAHDIAASATPENQLGEKLRAIAAEADEIDRQIAPWAASNHEIHLLKTKISELTAFNAMLKAELSRVKGTVSWQVTKPLRLIANLPRLVQERFKRRC